MRGQPLGLAVTQVIASEFGTVEPGNIVKMGNNITLKTYLHVDKDSPDRANIEDALTARGIVEYHLMDLQTGTPVTPPIAGGTISKLAPDDLLVAFGLSTDAPPNPSVGFEDLAESGLPQNGDYYISGDTANISTGDAGSGNNLVLPSGTSISGTWRVLTHVHENPPTNEVSAFDDDLLIMVYRA